MFKSDVNCCNKICLRSRLNGTLRTVYHWDLIKLKYTSRASIFIITFMPTQQVHGNKYECQIIQTWKSYFPRYYKWFYAISIQNFSPEPVISFYFPYWGWGNGGGGGGVRWREGTNWKPHRFKATNTHPLDQHVNIKQWIWHDKDTPLCPAIEEFIPSTVSRSTAHKTNVVLLQVLSCFTFSHTNAISLYI